MAWWTAVFKERDGSTEELEVSTSTTLQYEAWNKVTTMFPNKELLQLKSADELPTTLEEFMKDTLPKFKDNAKIQNRIKVQILRDCIDKLNCLSKYGICFTICWVVYSINNILFVIGRNTYKCFYGNIEIIL